MLFVTRGMNPTLLEAKQRKPLLFLGNNQGYSCRGIPVRKMGLLYASTGLDSSLHEVHPKLNYMSEYSKNAANVTQHQPY